MYFAAGKVFLFPNEKYAMRCFLIKYTFLKISPHSHKIISVLRWDILPWSVNTERTKWKQRVSREQADMNHVPNTSVLRILKVCIIHMLRYTLHLSLEMYWILHKRQSWTLKSKYMHQSYNKVYPVKLFWSRAWNVTYIVPGMWYVLSAWCMIIISSKSCSKNERGEIMISNIQYLMVYAL